LISLLYSSSTPRGETNIEKQTEKEESIGTNHRRVTGYITSIGTPFKRHPFTTKLEKIKMDE
jgi:hypothetical protein